MSDEEEGFLNRWSRRKQAVKEPLADEAQKKEDTLPDAGEQQAAAEIPEEEFDISKLPPLESITAGTDIRAFLSKGVPAALTQAALRRAWSADPAIRDYIGLSEYSWDFNSPGIDGFGPLDPSWNVQEMVADVFGKVKEAVANAESLAEKADSLTPPQQAADTFEPRAVDVRSEMPEPSKPGDSDSARAEDGTGDKIAQAAAAPQQPESEDEPLNAPVRRHGSALPS